MSISGFANLDGTQSFTNRFPEAFRNGFFQKINDLFLSTIGLGTYLGGMDDETDEASFQTMISCIKKGINIIDSAINYRAQRSERVIGKVLNHLISKNELRREEVFISTKGGFISFDSNPPQDLAAYFDRTFIASGILAIEDVVRGCHAISPKYIDHQIEQSRQNLNLETIDLYYLHNPETQLEEVSEEEFYRRLEAAFVVLEQKVSEGKIRMYGTATWNGYRLERRKKGYLSLEKVIETAKRAGGDAHHFKAIQLPYNLAMPEAFTHSNQVCGRELRSVIDSARRMGIMVFTSASLLQGRLIQNIPEQVRSFFPGIEFGSACALQFVRSTPGVTTALCGMKTGEHIDENLSLANVQPLSEDKFADLFSKG